MGSIPRLVALQTLTQANVETANCMESMSKKFSLHSRYYVKPCNEWRGPSPRFSVWATQKHRRVGDIVSDLIGRELKPRPPAPIAMFRTTGPTCRSNQVKENE